MKKRVCFMFVLCAMLLLVASAALAADAFRFSEKTVNIFEGDDLELVLEREGAPAADGTLTYSTGNKSIADVSADGVVHGLKKGQTTIRAKLTIDRKSWNAQITVNVLRHVTKVTLNTTRMLVYDPTDEKISGLLKQPEPAEPVPTEEGGEEPAAEPEPEPQYPVILMNAGKTADLRTTVTPESASSRKILYSTDDEGVAKVQGNTLRALQAGECLLTVASEQEPEVSEIFRILVVQPVTKLQIQAPARSVNVGSQLGLEVVYTPDNATIQEVTWTSKNTKVAVVDEYGTVTGLKRGSATIEAKAADGSNRTASINVTVTQKAESVTLKETDLNLATGKSAQLHFTVQPADTNDKSVTWSSSDPSVATVNSQGYVKGVSRGECVITAASNSDPYVDASIHVNVIQQVTKIEFSQKAASLPIRTTGQLSWTVYPEDASIKDVTFRSENEKIATVDQYGVVTGVKKGNTRIIAKAADGSGRTASIPITVTQPVEGISMQYSVYHVQLDGNLNIRAKIYPENANNQNVIWSTGDEYIVTVRGGNKNVGNMTGRHPGTTIVTGVTEDGGFSAYAEVRVADFNRAVIVDDLYLDNQNVRMVFRNRSDFVIEKVYFTVTMLDEYGDPLVCNRDQVSNSFSGSYDLPLYPNEQTEHYQFNFGKQYAVPLYPIGSVTVRITGWKDSEGYERTLSEEHQPELSWSKVFKIKPTEEPEPDVDLDPEVGGDAGIHG